RLLASALAMGLARALIHGREGVKQCGSRGQRSCELRVSPRARLTQPPPTANRPSLTGAGAAVQPQCCFSRASFKINCGAGWVAVLAVAGPCLFLLPQTAGPPPRPPPGLRGPRHPPPAPR